MCTRYQHNEASSALEVLQWIYILLTYWNSQSHKQETTECKEGNVQKQTHLDSLPSCRPSLATPSTDNRCRFRGWMYRCAIEIHQTVVGCTHCSVRQQPTLHRPNTKFKNTMTSAFTIMTSGFSLSPSGCGSLRWGVSHTGSHDFWLGPTLMCSKY